MGCIVCVTTSGAGDQDDAPLLSQTSTPNSSGSRQLKGGFDASLKKNRPGLGDKPVALASFRVRGALQSLLPKKSQAHFVSAVDEGAVEEDNWNPEDITETRELILERDHLGNT